MRWARRAVDVPPSREAIFSLHHKLIHHHAIGKAHSSRAAELQPWLGTPEGKAHTSMPVGGCLFLPVSGSPGLLLSHVLFQSLALDRHKSCLISDTPCLQSDCLSETQRKDHVLSAVKVRHSCASTLHAYAFLYDLLLSRSSDSKMLFYQGPSMSQDKLDHQGKGHVRVIYPAPSFTVCDNM